MEKVEKAVRRNRSVRFTDDEWVKIDAMIIAEPVMTKAQNALQAESNIMISTKTLGIRRNKLIAARQTLEAAILRQGEKEKAADPKTVQETLDTFLTIGKASLSVIGLILPEGHPQRKALIEAQGQMDSVLRRASEFRESFDHLSETRWLLNVMEIRVAKLFELEMTMGMPMRDNTANIQAMMEMIQQSLAMHQSLGLKPRFGDPKLNINVNVGGTAGGDGTEVQSERFKRLKALTDEYAKATPEQREGMRQRMLKEAKLGSSEPTTDATFTEVKAVNPEPCKVPDKC